MPEISTRTRIIFSTTALTLGYLVLTGLDLRQYFNLQLEFDPIKPLILAVFAYMLSSWVVHFKVRGERFLTILFFPAITVFALSLLSEILIGAIFSAYGQYVLILLSSLIFWFLTYITLSTINILNVSYLREIPLGQAGRASHFMLTLLVAYIMTFIVFSNDLFLVVKIALIFVITFLLVYISLWTINSPKNQRVTAGANISLLMSIMTFVMSLWPINSTYISLIIILVFYICLGIALEIREIINRWIWIEYGSIFVLIFLILFLLAEWGINGHLL